jgi:uncharacterized protein (TIGR02145 family)
MKSKLFFSTLLIFTMLSCKNKNDINNSRQSNDSPSAEVKNEIITNEVSIGNQIWTTKNLDVTTFRNGDPIKEAKSDADWFNAGKNEEPAWCYYANDPNNGNKYGKLYNWYAIIDERGLTPKGWHIPSKSEWQRLVDFLGGDKVAGKKMKNIDGWDDNGNGTNEIGFKGLPGGCRWDNGEFFGVGRNGEWWSSTEKNSREGMICVLYYWLDDVGPDKTKWTINNKSEGRSLRCIKDY